MGVKKCEFVQIPGYVTKLAYMPVYGKNIKNILLWKPEADNLKTWYKVSGAGVRPNLLK